MAIKPTEGHIDWITDDDSDKYIVPSAAKRLQGWVKEEKPPFQYFNWAWRLVDRWLKWGEAQSDENVAAIAANAQAIAANAQAIADEATARGGADSAHANGTSVHGATSAAVALSIMIRNSAAQSKVGPPSAPDDIARLDSITLAQLSIAALASDVNSRCAGMPVNIAAANGAAVSVTTTDGPVVALASQAFLAGDYFDVVVEVIGQKITSVGDVMLYLRSNAAGLQTITGKPITLTQTGAVRVYQQYIGTYGGGTNQSIIITVPCRCITSDTYTLSLRGGVNTGGNWEIAAGNARMALIFRKKQ